MAPFTWVVGLLAWTSWFSATAEAGDLKALPLPKNDDTIKASTQEEVILLAVDKSRLLAELRTLPDTSDGAALLRTFRIAIGKEAGDKEKEGDNRTPEGVYFSRGIIDGGQLPAKYGPKAIPINFPNPIDVMSRKSGHGIWLHGVENDARIEEANVTEGCVAFYNDDIMRLARWLRPHQGIIVIADDAQKVNRPEDMASLRQSTESWVEHWKTRDLPNYVSYYDRERFRFRGWSLEQFRDYKKRVFDSYTSMLVRVDDLRVVTHPKYAVTIMNQDFNGDDRFISNGRKILYWNKDELGQWRIVHEDFERRRLETIAYTPEQLATLAGPEPRDPSRSAALSGDPIDDGHDDSSEARRESPKL